MARHEVDPTERGIDSDDLATWLLFFLEAHGAAIVLREDNSVRVDLNPMMGLDAETVARWAPVITTLIPEMRAILVTRAEP
jgi:hypothetical protein